MSDFNKLITEFNAGIARVNSQYQKLQQQVDAIDEKHQRLSGGFGSKGSDPAEAIVKGLVEHKEQFDATARSRFEVPSVLLNSKGFTSTGLVAADPSSRIGLAAGAPAGAVRALFPVVPADSGSVFTVRESASTGWAASPQTEASAKAESTATLTGETLGVRTIAHWCQASRQSLDDVVGLSEFIRARLLWGLNAKVDQEIVSGDNTGEHLSGLTTSATAFSTALLVASKGWDLYGILGAAAVQCRTNGFNPTFALCHPTDVYRMRFLRDSTGQYVQPPPIPAIVESTAISQGSFIVGDATQAVLRVRMSAVIDLSESHSDFYVKNLVALRCEERLALQIISPSAFIAGSLSASPA